jgi:8-oxo-dGTP diphosphatase
MKPRVLFGTASKAKIGLIRAFLEPVWVEILSPEDLRINIQVVEDGHSPEENAQKKALAYFAEAKMPTFSIDAGLTIEKFPVEIQPGVFVRRIFGTDSDASDREILDYYIRELNKVGGTSPGSWQIAIASVMRIDQVFVKSYTLKTIFTSQASPILMAGAPLSSLMIDPGSGKYYSEMTETERPDSGLIAEVIRQFLEVL